MGFDGLWEVGERADGSNRLNALSFLLKRYCILISIIEACNVVVEPSNE